MNIAGTQSVTRARLDALQFSQVVALVSDAGVPPATLLEKRLNAQLRVRQFAVLAAEATATVIAEGLAPLVARAVRSALAGVPLLARARPARYDDAFAEALGDAIDSEIASDETLVMRVARGTRIAVEQEAIAFEPTVQGGVGTALRVLGLSSAGDVEIESPEGWADECECSCACLSAGVSCWLNARVAGALRGDVDGPVENAWHEAIHGSCLEFGLVRDALAAAGLNAEFAAHVASETISAGFREIEDGIGGLLVELVEAAAAHLGLLPG